MAKTQDVLDSGTAPTSEREIISTGGRRDAWIQPPHIGLAGAPYSVDAGGVYARPITPAEISALDAELAVWDDMSSQTYVEFEASLEASAED
jgi:hypothetical protein